MERFLLFYAKFQATSLSIHELFTISAVLYSIFLEFWWTLTSADFCSVKGDLRYLHFDITIVFPVFEANVTFFDTTLCHLYLKVLCFIKNEPLYFRITERQTQYLLSPVFEESSLSILKLKVHKATTRIIWDTALTYRQKLTQKSSPHFL